MINPDDFYTDAQRKLQNENDSSKLSDAVVEDIVRDELEDPHIGFISSRDFFFLSTVNSKGEPTVSYKGGPIGFVYVKDSKSLVFPNYDGNGMFYSMGNAMETGKVGLLFIDFETPHRVRVQGNAKVTKDPALMSRYPGSSMVVEIEVTSAFINCARYIHKHQRVETSKYVPDQNGEQPFPSWKRLDHLQDVLPEKDKGRALKDGGTIDMDEYIDRLMKGNS